MGMTSEQFLESFVEWNRADCSDRPGDTRRGFNANVFGSHLADHGFFHAKRCQPDFFAQFHTRGEFSHLLEPF
jgi:hypothetical protein